MIATPQVRETIPSHWIDQQTNKSLLAQVFRADGYQISHGGSLAIMAGGFPKPVA
jgi:hypothetical protein